MPTPLFETMLRLLVASSLATDPRALTPEQADPDLGPRPMGGPRVATPSPDAPPDVSPPASPRAEGPSSPPAASTETPVDAPAPRGPCLRTPGQCRQLTITGSVFVGLSAAAIATGIGLRVRPNEPIDGKPAFESSTHPPGVMLIGMGAGVLITGVLMLIAGRRAHRLASGQASAAAPGPRLGALR